MSNSPHLLKFSRARLGGHQISELVGLCRGLIADGKIVQSEAEALHAWLIDQEGTGLPLVEATRAQVGQMLQDEVLDANESAKLMQLIRSLIGNHVETAVPSNRDGRPASKLDDYQIAAPLGLCRGLVADGKVDQSEADTLRTWMMAHEGTVDNPVMTAFRQKLEPVIKREGNTDNGAQLLQLLDGLVGGKTEIGECMSSTTLWLDDPPPEVVFENRKSCLTGKFRHVTRGQCEAEVKVRQGIC